MMQISLLSEWRWTRHPIRELDLLQQNNSRGLGFIAIVLVSGVAFDGLDKNRSQSPIVTQVPVPTARTTDGSRGKTLIPMILYRDEHYSSNYSKFHLCFWCFSVYLEVIVGHLPLATNPLCVMLGGTEKTKSATENQREKGKKIDGWLVSSKRSHLQLQP